MIGDLIQILLLCVCVVLCFRYARRAEDKLWLIYSALSASALLISDLYYLTHSFLLEGIRIPFAANDIADFGFFLLLSTSLNTAIGSDRRKRLPVYIGAAVFAAANVALWIAWSGEWLRDLLGGVSFGWFICTAIHSVYYTKALSRWERAAMWTVSALLIAVQTAVFLVPLPLKGILDKSVATGLMGAGELLLLVRTGLALRRSGRANAALSLSFVCHCWGLICMYMSADPYYTVFSNLCTLSILLTLLAIRKKVKSA